MENRTSRSRLFRIGMAAVLTCGLMMPAGAFAADNGTPPPAINSVADIFEGQLSDQPAPDQGAPATDEAATESPAAVAQPVAADETEIPDQGSKTEDPQSAVDSEQQPSPSLSLTVATAPHAALAQLLAPDDSPQDADADTSEIPVAQSDGWTVTGSLKVLGGIYGVDYIYTPGAMQYRGGDYTIAGTPVTNVLEILSSTPLVIQDAAPFDQSQAGSNAAAYSDTGIVIREGVHADLTFDGVNIRHYTPVSILTNSYDTEDGSKATDGTQVRNRTSLHLTLADGSYNSLWGITVYLAPLHCGEGSDFTMDDSVRNVDANGNMVLPIGGIINEDVTLVGGKTLKKGELHSVLDSSNPGMLTIYGVQDAASIGGNNCETGGRMTFNGGVLNATYAGNSGCAAGIGAGSGGNGTDTLILFNSGNYTVAGGYHGAGVGAACYDGYSGAGIYESDNIASRSYNTPTVAGDITIHGGYIRASGGGHGNGFGAACWNGAAGYNTDHTITVTGGTLYPTGSVGDLGGYNGYVVVTGGSVYAGPGKFIGVGGTAWGNEAYKEPGYNTADPNDPNKVMMMTINLKSEIEKRNDQAGITGSTFDETVTSWTLTVGGQEYNYGAPKQFLDGQLYLWLPSSAFSQEVTVTMTYVDKNGVEQTIEPLFRQPSGSQSGSTLKRYITFELPEDFRDMSKYYDGTPLPGLSISDDTPIEATDNKLLSDPDAVTYKYQRYTSDKQTPLGEETAAATEMPSDVGVMKLTVDSTQFSGVEGFRDNYWGHRATGWCEIKQIGSRVSLIEAKWEDGKDASVEDNARKQITITADIRRAEKDPDGNLTKSTCQAPRGYVQLFIDRQPVGDKIKLVFPDDVASGASTVAEGDDVLEVNAAVVPDGAGSYTRITHTIVPPDQDYLVPNATANKKHEVSLQYIQPTQDDAAPANYMDSVNPADNPDAAPRAELAIEPVNPHPTVSVEPEPDNTDPTFPEPEVTTKPETSPDTVGPKEFEGTITTTYGKPTDTLKYPGRVLLKVKTPSSGEISVTGEDGSLYTADFVRDEDGNPVRNADGTYTLVLDPTAVGKGTLTFAQKPNGAYTGSTWTYNVIVEPSPQIAPEPKLSKEVVNLTNPDGPTRPGDRLLYTITASNAAAGSAWTQVVITDPIPASMALVENTLELDNPKDGRDGLKLVRADSVTAANVGSFALAENAEGKTVLSVPAGTVYGGAAATLTFECIVNEDVAFLTAGEGDLSLGNTASAQGKRLNPDDPDGEDVDLDPEPNPRPGEGPTPTTPSVNPPGPGTIVPFDPDTSEGADIAFSKTVDNLTDAERTVTKVGDTLRYRITLANHGDTRSVLWDAAITDPLPQGIELKLGTMKLTVGDGDPMPVDDGAYDAATRTIAVNVGDLWGGASAVLTFECAVTKDAFGQNNANVAFYHGTTPSGDPDHDPKGGDTEPGTPAPGTEDEPTGPTPPASIPEVLPGDPVEGDIAVEKRAENLSGAQETKVGDTIRYAITLSNSSQTNGWMDAIVRDDVPRGLEPLKGSIKLTLPDGTALAVDDAAYDNKTRRLCVAVGRLFPGQAVTLFFDALVTDQAVGADIGNIAVAMGQKPSQWEGSDGHPTPGSPFNPEDDLAADWPSYESAVEKVESPKAYPAGTDESNGPSKEPTGGGGSQGGNPKPLPTTIAKDRGDAEAAAKTGDALGIALALGLALAAGGATTSVLARNRMRRAPRHR